MSDDVVLPDDVVDFLRRAVLNDRDTDRAVELLDEYAPEPRVLGRDSLEGFGGAVTFRRTYGDYGTEQRFDESDHPGGVGGAVWPDDGGREACELLNDGWRLVRSDELVAGNCEVKVPSGGVWAAGSPAVKLIGRQLIPNGGQPQHPGHYVLAREIS